MSSTPDADQALLSNGITLAAGSLEATFLPRLGLLGSSLRHRGEELLALPAGLDGYRAGQQAGLPLLAPWANRLGASSYEVAGVRVDLTGLDLPTDEHGLPIHGTLTAHPGWAVVDRDERALVAELDFGARASLLESFPFPHRLQVRAEVEPEMLTVATTLSPTGDRAVPVSFGYHPYLRLPGVGRDDVLLRLPARHHLDLDERGLPTGAERSEEAQNEPVGERLFDDLYRLGDDRMAALSGAGRRVAVALTQGYGYLQVFAPADADFVCLEPMTAPVTRWSTAAARWWHRAAPSRLRSRSRSARWVRASRPPRAPSRPAYGRPPWSTTPTTRRPPPPSSTVTRWMACPPISGSAPLRSAPAR